MERVDVAIVGGGPAGTSAAHAAARNGATALVCEKGIPREDRDGPGPDSTDAAGILDYWVDIMGIHPEEFPDGVVQRVLDRAEFVGPNSKATLYGTGIESSYDHFGYTFHRARFDDWLRERAENAGAEYRVAAVKDVETDLSNAPQSNTPRHVLSLASGETVGADFLILADGPQRQVTNRVLDTFLPDDAKASDRLASRKVNHIAYQEYRRFPGDAFDDVDKSIRFWWGVMPGHTAYPWVFPNNDRICRVGLTMPIGLDIDEVTARDDYRLLRPDDDRIPSGREYIQRLMEWQYGDEYDVESDFPIVGGHGKRDGTETYAISSTQPIESPTKAGIAVAGGAMGSTSAFHEGGDHVAVRTGTIAGELAATGDLSHYNRRWQDAIGDEVLRNLTMAEVVRGYTPTDWDRVISSADTMLAAETGHGLLERTYSAGFQAIKMVLSYKWQKRKLRNAYVQMTEDEYMYST